MKLLDVLLLACSLVLLFSELSHALTVKEYVDRDDGEYKYTQVLMTSYGGVDVHVLRMTSQKWMDANFSDTSVWVHDVIICIPTGVPYLPHKEGLLVLSGYSNLIRSAMDLMWEPYIPYLMQSALYLQTSVTLIRQMPNQRITFTADPDQRMRSEDDQLAYLWNYYIENNEASEEVISVYPMTKAVVKAFDTITDYTKQLYPTGYTEKFIIVGGSKRGWASWAVSAIDDRIVAQVPVVMPLVNGHEVLMASYRSLGGWTFAMSDYVMHGVLGHLNHERFTDLMSFVNPFSTIEKYTMPTLVIMATGDQFFQPDATRFFFSQLPGEKYLSIQPNVGHDLSKESYDLISVFSKSIIKGRSRPRVEWNILETEDQGRIDLTITGREANIIQVCSWSALSRTNTSRDFRAHYYDEGISYSGVWWRKSCNNLNRRTRKHYVIHDAPSSGWLAFYIEVKFREVDGKVLTLSSELSVVPPSYPFPRCTGPTGCDVGIV